MSTLFSSINVALRALLSHQAAIQVIEHNVANANTPGFRRQEAILSAGLGYPPASMFHTGLVGQIGSGVYVEQIRRFNLDFFDGRFRRELAETSRWELQRQALQQVEATLSETGEDSLTANLDAFWDGWQALSSNPGDMGTRADLLQRARDLVDGLNGRASHLSALRAGQDATIVQEVAAINDLAGQIAGLNVEIIEILAIGSQPNDLLDQRDRLLDRLSELTGAVAYDQENGSVSVSIGGHALVVGDTAFTLVTAPDPGNGNLARISWEDGHDFDPTRGELAGMLDVRDRVIPAQMAGLDELAATLIDQVNAMHRGGYGLNDATDLDFFTGSDALSIRVADAMEDLENIASAAAPESPGDGSIAGEMAALRSALLMGGESLTIGQFYTNQVFGLGLEIRQAGTDAVAHQLVVDNLEAQREAVSGVSLDEEAANLIKSQRAYEAAIRLMTVLDEMVDRIINGMGRAGL